jgi:small glutamine-rich tetratricopeptide repeat-containing protein alpha
MAKKSTPVPSPMVVETPKEEVKIDVEQAEKHKNEGNAKLNAKQYNEAIECYTKAIQMNPENHIYFANRAAALSHLGKHQEAIQDCEVSIRIAPSYAKAFGRLG